jgi:cytochrome c oxidase assembly factor CtaG
MVAALCAIVFFGYMLGSRRPVRVVGSRRRWGARQWRTTAFTTGLGIVLVSLYEPIDAIVRQTFWARTAQLMILVMVAAPLLVVGGPTPRFQRLLNWTGSARSLTAGKVRSVAAFCVFNLAVLIAYLPAVYRMSAGPGWPRLLSQLTVVILGFVFWSQVIAQPPRACALSHLGRAAYLFLSSALLRVLGVVLGFAPASFYGVPLTDQQLAAGIVMVPGVLTDLIVLTVCLYLWLGQEARSEQRRTQKMARAF